jgi:hypothetical protein
MAVDAGAREPARLALVDLLLEQHAKEAFCRPTFAVGLLGQVGPQPPHRGESQFCQHEG